MKEALEQKGPTREKVPPDQLGYECLRREYLNEYLAKMISMKEQLEKEIDGYRLMDAMLQGKTQKGARESGRELLCRVFEIGSNGGGGAAGHA